MSDYKPVFSFGTEPLSQLRETEPLILNHSQTVAFHKTLDILSKYPAVMNTSIMGAGKTYWTVALAIALKLPMLIVCPPTVIPVWETIVKKFGIETLAILSYGIFSGMKTRGCKHAFLTRKGDVWKPTQELLAQIDEGVLFVMDESHKTKNKIASYKEPCHIVSNLIADAFYKGGKSRIAALSGTPGDKEVHATSILQIMGFCKEKVLLTHTLNVGYDMPGLQEVIDHCYAVDPQKTEEIMAGVKISAKSAEACAFRLYVEILKDRVTVDMPVPEFKAIQHLYSGHFQFLPEDLEISKIGEKMLKEHVEFKGGKWVMKDGRNSLGEVNKALQLIEWSKLNACARTGIEMLNDNPNSKLVVFAWHKAAIRYLMDQFRDYRVAQFSGMNKEKRKSVLAKFQEPNTDIRVLIVSAKVGAMGLSMDDQSEGGLFPRNFFVIPNYEFTLMEQAFGRFQRQSSTSDSIGYVVFSNDFTDEEAILKAVFNKSSVCGKFLSGGRKVGLDGKSKRMVEESHHVYFQPQASKHQCKALVEYYVNNNRHDLVTDKWGSEGFDSFIGLTKQNFQANNGGFVPPQQYNGFNPNGASQSWGQPQGQGQNWGPPRYQNQNQNVPPQQGYAPPQQGYTPPQQGYAPPQQGYTPPQQGYNQPSQGGFQTRTGYTPPSPSQNNYAPSQQGYTPPQSGGYIPPQQSGYTPPQSGGYTPPHSGYTPPQRVY